MRQSLDPKTDTGGGTSRSKINFAPEAFSLNQRNAVCLPLISERKKLVWVHSNQISLQVDGAAELDKAFDRIPYLTQKQTAALAKKCSLHPDQVKVWFMVQRLRYGISWDFEDIRNVRKKLESSQGTSQRTGKSKRKCRDELKEDRRERKKQRREVKECGGNAAGEFVEEQRANKATVNWEHVSVKERLNIKVKQEPPMKTEKERLHVRPPLIIQPECTLPPQVSCNKKRATQQSMLRMAFLQCQYPNREDYSRLEMQIGISHTKIIQWFGVIRYSVKRAKPDWMSCEQHRKVVANIKYSQLLKALAREKSRKGRAERKLEVQK